MNMAENAGELDYKEELSPEFKEVIEKLPHQIPEDFRKRAVIAARYISELDSGETDRNESRKRFRDQLYQTGFI